MLKGREAGQKPMKGIGFLCNYSCKEVSKKGAGPAPFLLLPQTVWENRKGISKTL